jgi:hypothetical protein
MINTLLFAFFAFQNPLDDPNLRQAAEAARQFGGKGFFDYSEDLRKPGVAVVYGSIVKYTEVKKERISEKDAVLGEGGMTLSMLGTVYYRIEAKADLTITETLAGDVKGKSVSILVTLQSAKLNDGSERFYILTRPPASFSTPANGVWVLEREKGKKDYRATRGAKYDVKNEPSADPLSTIRKRVEDQHAVNKRKADLTDALEKHAAARTKELVAESGKRLKALDEAKKSYQLVETDAVAAQQLGPLEKRVKETLAEIAAAASRPAESRPANPAEKPPE